MAPLESRDRQAARWLIESDDPAVGALAQRDLLRDSAGMAEAFAASPTVASLLSGQLDNGGFGVHPYRKWSGAHWRLVSVVEARSLVEWQWLDGGWNCDKVASGHRSSLHESLIPMWGLHEYAEATGARWAADASRRTSDLLLDHRLFRVHGTGRAINSTWTRLRFPAYWHYGILPALVALVRMGLVDDPRAGEAVALLRARRLPDGRWPVQGRWWRTELVDCGGSGPNPWVTLQALRVLCR